MNIRVAFISYYPGEGGGGGVGHSTKFYTARLFRDVQSLLPFYIPVTPFVYLLLTDSTPLIYLV